MNEFEPMTSERLFYSGANKYKVLLRRFRRGKWEILLYGYFDRDTLDYGRGLLSIDCSVFMNGEPMGFYDGPRISYIRDECEIPPQEALRTEMYVGYGRDVIRAAIRDAKRHLRRLIKAKFD